mmetsp:Transcript_10429/g.17270  ORF Transcript_10429/g.17270 Transcript_10429/m.17270 type:complete len:307 (-) Transcript_10429:91-1011(-)|eukprot:CAMPEP_0119014282 /NCGR_PEP_ID=MMETSP1176-20130426/9453_1 /TAXON_ID=265551 /ORGANISM="Synedropsis recta cf, Strain CCMP1620" /LENGTH=306 /DNA_ID=CAMNT_0006967437 /DNA_START=112 /DNA_END=1032 /DNA_ORIENTATION=+
MVSKKSKSTSKPIILSNSVQKHDVLLGRGKKRFKHPGNIAYRAFIESRISFYFEGGRIRKSGVVLEIIESIKKTGGRFLKDQKGAADWEEADLRVAREKVGHSIRDHCKSNISFDFQEDMKETFDETATFDDVLAYVQDNYKPIMAQISAGDHTSSNAKSPRFKKKQQEEYSSDEEDDDATPTIVLEDDDVSSISSAGSDADESDQEMEIEDVPRIPGRRESNLVCDAHRRRSSSYRASFVKNFLFKLNEETERLDQQKSLESLRDNADNFRLISIASIRDWIDVDECSQSSDDEWSAHLVSLASA